MVGAALACGGRPSVPVRAHLEQVCAALPAFGLPDGIALPPITGEAADVPDETPISFFRGEVWVGPRRVDALDELPDVLRADAALHGRPVRTVVVLAEAATRAWDVIPALEAAHDAGVTSLALVGRTDRPFVFPAAPDPALAEEIRAELAGVDPSMRAVLLADRMSAALGLCPGGSEVFAALALVSPEHECEILAAGLDEALPSCLLTDADAVVTVTQAMLTPQDTHRPGTITVGFDRGGPPLLVDSDATWEILVGQVDRIRPRAVWFAPGE